MNPLPTRLNLPDAVRRRGGPCRVALPNDPGLDGLLADTRIGSTAKTIATALVKNWAWSKDHCWPADATIAAKVGKSPGHVQRCLRQLETAGWIEREHTHEVASGRRLWLLWRCPDGRPGARPHSTPARTGAAAPARSEQVVIVNERMEPGGDADPRRSRSPADPPPPVISPPDPELTRQPAPATQEAPSQPEDSRTPQPFAVAAQSPLRAFPGPTPPPTPPRAAPASPFGRRPWLSLAELASVVVATADPILARELARRTAPPPPPEPSPQSLPTGELLARLPGRHDLVMAAARRLCVETGDEKLATLRTFEVMCRTVASWGASAELLAGCLRQAMGPLSRERGKVLVAAWQRDYQCRQ